MTDDWSAEADPGAHDPVAVELLPEEPCGQTEVQDAATLASALRESVAQHGRRPSWRSLNDPYKLAVAEILLQKTKGGDAEPVWHSVVATYPDAESLTAAPDEELRQIVGHLGLGQQRVQRLKAMAFALAASEQQVKLPGLGPYGGAIIALAGGEKPADAPVDGNVARVICRVYDLVFERGEPRKKPEVKTAVMELLNTGTSPQEMLQVAYALVDLGALICLPHRPLCPQCPLRLGCCFAARAAR